MTSDEWRVMSDGGIFRTSVTLFSQDIGNRWWRLRGGCGGIGLGGETDSFLGEAWRPKEAVRLEIDGAEEEVI